MLNMTVSRPERRSERQTGSLVVSTEKMNKLKELAMKILYVIAAVTGIVTFCLFGPSYAHGPNQATGQPRGRPTTTASRRAPPSASSQMFHAYPALPVSPNPSVSLQQALNRTQLQNSVIAPQLGLSNAGGLAGLQPRLQPKIRGFPPNRRWCRPASKALRLPRN